MARGRAKISIAERRHRVARLCARKLTQREIARTLGISQATVSRDVGEIEKQWMAEARAELDSHRARELSELQAMERDLATIAATDPDPSVKIRAMAERRQVKARIASMIGLDAPAKHEHTGKDSGPIETRDEAAAEASALLRQVLATGMARKPDADPELDA